MPDYDLEQYPVWIHTAAHLSERPRFDKRTVRDVNPTSGTDRERVVYAPNRAMRTIHQRLNDYLKEVVLPATQRWSAHATACRQAVGVVHDVIAHRGARCLYVTDVLGAFPSLRAESLAHCLAALEGLPGEKRERMIREFLERYCFAEGGRALIVGGNASNLLFELYGRYEIDRVLVQRLEVELGAWVVGFARQPPRPQFATFMDCLANRDVGSPITWWLRQNSSEERERTGIRLYFTRYLDDLKVSCTEALPFKTWERIKRIVRETIEQAGLRPNDRKTHFYDLTKGEIQLNGIGLAYGGRMFVPRPYLRACRQRMNDALERLRLYLHCHQMASERSLEEARSVISRIRSAEGQISHIMHIMQASRRSGDPPNGTDQAFLRAAEEFWRETANAKTRLRLLGLSA